MEATTDPPALPPQHPHRYSTQSTISSLSSSASSSSLRSSSGSSSNNGRLAQVSSLNIRVPDNRPFLPHSAGLAGGGAGGGGGDAPLRPGSSLSRSWSNGEGETEGEGEDQAWQDIEVLPDGAGRGEQEGDEDQEEGNPATPVVFPSSSSSHSVLATVGSAGDEPEPTVAELLLPVEQEEEPALISGVSFFSDEPSTLSSEVSLGGGASLADGLGINLGLGIASSGLSRRVGGAADGASQPQRWTPEPFPALPSPSEVPPYDAVPPLPSSSSTYSSPHQPLQNGSASIRSEHPSIASRSTHLSTQSNATAASSNSSTLSLPTAPPVDLALPSTVHRPGGTYVSVANSHMASLAASNSPVNRNSHSTSSARSFFSSLLNRSPRMGSQSPRFSPTPSPSSSPMLGGPSRSPSAPQGWAHQHPSVTSLQSSGSDSHARSNSMPVLNGGGAGERGVRDSSDLYRPEGSDVPQRRTPRAFAAATFAGLTRSSSMGGGRVGGGSPRLGSGSPVLPSSSSSPFGRPATPQTTVATDSPVPSIGFATPPLPNSSASGGGRPPPPPTLASIGLNVSPLTQPMGLSRNGQPLCGALLDNKYLLIGTTTGLDFLPLPLPGSLPMKQHGKKRKETRKPISLIKRTRFKELAVLSERSNILLAIAGRNDHIRVYALDGIRSMIEKKMQEMDKKEGYPVIQDAVDAKNVKGKAKATIPLREVSQSSTSSSTRPTSTFPPPVPAPSVSTYLDPSPSYQFPPSSAPPDYTLPAPSPRRRPPSTSRPPSWHQGPSSRPSSFHSIGGSALPPSSPVRISSRTTATSASFVRAVPTNPNPRGSVSSQTTVTPGTPRGVRGQKSREFLAGRKGSTATMKRRSRADLQGVGSTGVSRRGSVVSASSGRRGSTRTTGRGAESAEDAEDEAEPGLGRRPSAPLPDLPSSSSSTSSQTATSRRPSAAPSDTSVSSPFYRPPSRMEPRPPIKTVSTDPTQRSPTSDLAEFLKVSGPEMHSPEMDNVLHSSRQRRRSSVTESLLGVPKNSHLFPSSASSSNHSSPVRSSFDRSATTSNLAGLALYAPNGEGGRDELVEMLQESVAEVASDQRRASMNDFRHPSAMQREEEQARVQYRRASTLTTSDSPSRPYPRPAPREATTPRLRAGQKSPSMEIAALLAETGPEDLSSSSSTSTSTSPPHPRSAADKLHQNGTQNEPLAAVRPIKTAAAEGKGKAPENGGGVSNRLVARSPVAAGTESTDETDGEGQARRRTKSVTLAEVMREGPPPSLSASMGPASSTGLGISSSPAAPSPGGASPSTRSSKRWTMSGVGSMLLSRPRSSSQSGEPKSPVLGRPSSSSSARAAQVSRTPSDTRQAPTTSWDTEPAPSRPSTSLPPPATSFTSQRSSSSHPDFKRRPTTSLHRSEPPAVAPSSQAPPDAHPASSASPLEYVKLARTKGARLLRATETKKRTYLAVLCGEEGERIELFTGSRSISLSLNRTFVLPETPRTVELQIQGDDLVDLYLVYSESIFALEPATVRVREVGVGRGERRARRERERRLRNISATSREAVDATDATVTGAPPVRSPALQSALHPADPLREQPPVAEDSVTEGEELAVPLLPRARTPSPSPSPSPAPAAGSDEAPPTDAAAPTQEAPPPAFSTEEAPAQPRVEAVRSTTTAQVSAAANGDEPRSSTRSTKSSLPYSTFQQLSFVPPVPSAVLSSAWTIPPLYTDVVAGSPAPPSSSTFESFQQPAIRVTGANGAVSDATEQSAAEARAAVAAAATNPDLPLLSPISLLGGAALRANGPPGLFFVSKGKNLSGIVTADGKSIIKRPLVWANDHYDPSEATTDVPQRIEVLVVGGRNTVVVKISTQDVKCISVEGASATNPFSPALTVSSPTRPTVQFLATHNAGQQLFFAETVGTSSYTVRCLSAI